MTTTRPPIVRAKLRPPTPTPDLIVRSRLITRVVETPARVWSVVAPAGFGKTTLLVRAIEEAGLAVAWVSVDTADDHPVRFWSHVAAALADAGVDTGRAIAPLLVDDVDQALDEIVAAIEERPDGSPDSTGDLLLVLDDVHEIANPAVIRGLERLVAHPPERVTIALTARHELDLGLARRRLHGDVVELLATDLAFTRDEGRLALASEIDSGLLDLDAADSLIDRLDGWPAGVRLAQLALRGVSPGAGDAGGVVAQVTGASPEVASYLAAEVLAGLTPDVRGFLVDTSILMNLTPGLCDAVTGRSDSLATLRSLAADQVFTSLIDAATSTFRVHRIFREFLIAQADELPDDERRELHRRAMRWYRPTGDLDPIVWHATRAGDFVAALDAVGEQLFDASNRGQIDDMWRWIEWIGSERVLADPVLGALPAWVSLNQRRYDEIDPWLEAIAMVDGIPDEQLRMFDVHAATVRSVRDRRLGDLSSAVEHGRCAEQLVAADPDMSVAPTVAATLAQALAVAGDAEAGQVARRAVDLAAEAGHEPALVTAYASLACALDDPAAAAAAADSALSLVTSPDLERFHRPSLAWFVRARAAFDSGRVGDAREAVMRAVELAAIDEPAVLALAWALDARILHLLGRDDERRQALRSADSVLDELTGASWVDDQVRSAHAATRFAPGVDDPLPVGARELSDRELAVLRMLPFELPRRELAAQLYVSENTVKTHLTSIRRKLGLRGRADIVERARELGVLDGDAGSIVDGG